jgi:hypothetical protein
MANQSKGGALAKYGSILGPVAGVIVGVLLIAWAVMTDDVREKRQQLDGLVSEVSNRLASQAPTRDLPAFPGAEQVSNALRPDDHWDRQVPASAVELRRLPMNWDVRIDAPEEDFFDRFAGEKGYWIQTDFYDAKDYDPQRVQGEFGDYRKSNPDRLTRQEFEAGPIGDADAQFDALLKTGDR